MDERSWAQRAKRATVAVIAEGATFLAVAAFRIVSRTLLWATIGLLGAAVVYFLLSVLGLLVVEWRHGPLLRWGLLPAYLIVGAGLLGYAGLWQGVGCTLLYIGVERGLIAAVVDRVLDGAVALLRRTERGSAALDGVAVKLRDIPLQRVEDALGQSIEAYVSSDDLEGELTGLRRRAARAVKRALVRLVEKYLLTVVRAEADENGGGGVSMERVLDVAPGRAAGAVRALVEKRTFRLLLRCAALALAILAVAPVTMAFFR